MRYWWDNQYQTYRQETGGDYKWSPKVTKNGKLNLFDEFMREVARSWADAADPRLPAHAEWEENLAQPVELDMRTPVTAVRQVFQARKDDILAIAS